MRQFLLALVVVAGLALASTAGAQTTTSTSTSTSSSTSTSTSSSTSTSTLAAGSAWTCVIDGKDITTAFYWTVGHCVATGAYTTSGGDAIGSAATAAATALTVCGSGNQTVKLLLTTQEPAGAVVPATCGFDMSTWKYVCSNQATASASTAMVESTISAVVMSPFKFLAVCK
jgi:hypothetical protein